jgi:hypothetical protein
MWQITLPARTYYRNLRLGDHMWSTNVSAVIHVGFSWNRFTSVLKNMDMKRLEKQKMRFLSTLKPINQLPNYIHLGRGHSPRKLVTAISENCYQTELIGAAQIEDTATRLQGNSRKTEKLNVQATEQASLLTVAFPRSFLVSTVLTWFCDSFPSLDGMKCWWSC